MDDRDQYIPIKAWSVQDRPREKLRSTGCKNLSDAELLAILIGSGTKQESALSIANKILQDIDFDLVRLGKLTVRDLTQFRGVGSVKAIGIVAAVELGRRRQFAHRELPSQIIKSQDAFRLIGAKLSDLKAEEFWILLLNRNNRLITKSKISRGGVAGTVVDPKLVFKEALDNLASSLILAHNHPSGNIRPSKADRHLTEKLIRAGELMDIKIVDHLIIGENRYFSFADEGLI